MRAPRVTQPLIASALAALELNSIAAGIEALDAMLKEAPVTPLWGQAASPGKYLILLTGNIEDLQRALARGLRVARDQHGHDSCVDDLLLPSVAPELQRQLQVEGSVVPQLDNVALGILETYSAPSLLGGVDTALKTGETQLLSLHLLQGIGGKGTAVISGDVESVRLALDAGANFAASRDSLTRKVLIPHPDAGLAPFLGG